MALVAGVGAGQRAAAHAFLESSDPAANAVVPDTPTRVTMRFTEPLERVASTRVALFDQFGQQVDGTRFEFDDRDRNVMILVIPDRLAPGTYSVVWRTLSSADGHPAQGYIPFTIGTVNDIQSVIPPDFSDSSGPPQWLQTLARWVSYVGLAIVVGVWPVWLLVLRPAISPAWQAGPRLVRRVRALTYVGVGIALVGSLLALYVQVDRVSESGGFFSAIGTTLADTRFGRIWIFRVALLLAMGVAYMGAAWWWPRRERAMTVGMLGLAAVLPLPFALIAHASAQTSGRTTAIAVDMLHLLAASIWVGGLAALIGGLIPGLRDLTPAGRRVVLQRAIPRFSATALASWGAIILTGLYSGWLQVGGWRPLRETAYGTSLSIKLLLIAALLVLAAFNLVVVSRHVKRLKDDGETAVWGRRFTYAVVAEVVLVLAVLLVTGRLTTQAPARETLAQAENQIDLAFDLQGRSSTLSLAPGKPGPNHYRLEVGGDPLPADTEALLRMTPPSINAGQNEVSLQRVAGNAFETHGSEISVAGNWSIQVIVRQIGGFQYTSTIRLPVEPAGSSSLPRAAWTFSGSGAIGLVMILIGFAAFAFAWWAGTGPQRKEGLGIGAVAIALGALLLLQARETTASGGVDLTISNPIPPDAASITRGMAAFQANCVQCHGPGGRGDGPSAAAYNPPPADFASAHSRAHLDAEFFNWIKNGKPPTAMPAFGDTLTDEQIWDLVNYIRDIQRQAPAGSSSPSAPPVATPETSPTPAP